MTQASDTVIAVFDDRASAEAALADLKAAGFRPEDVSVVAHHPGDRATPAEHHHRWIVDPNPSEGIFAGGLIGGVAGWLIGAASLAVPGVGAFLAAGALASAVSGAGVGAAVGGLIDALTGSGVPEEHARWSEERVRAGAVLLSVHGGRLDDARAIMRRHGGHSPGA